MAVQVKRQVVEDALDRFASAVSQRIAMERDSKLGCYGGCEPRSCERCKIAASRADAARLHETNCRIAVLNVAFDGPQKVTT